MDTTQRVNEFLKELQGLCFKHKVKIQSGAARLADQKNILISCIVAEADGCQSSVLDENAIGFNKKPKKVATGKFQ